MSSSMASYVKLLRLLVLPACIGSLFAALVMLLLGALKLYAAAQAIWADGAAQSATITSAIMGATDAFLFGVVLIVFSGAFAEEFIFPQGQMAHSARSEPMRFHGLGNLKRTLLEVIFVFLIVDTATDLASAEDPLGWTILIKPSAVALVAFSIRVMFLARNDTHQTDRKYE